MVNTVYYEACDLASDPIIESQTSIAAFQQDVIREQDVYLESSSQKLAVDDAQLLISFWPKTILPQAGKISVQVPSWYTVSELPL